MFVHELIEHLQELPEDVPVLVKTEDSQGVFYVYASKPFLDEDDDVVIDICKNR